jgi:hypothetical protein
MLKKICLGKVELAHSMLKLEGLVYHNASHLQVPLSFQVRFQLHWGSKILLNCPPQERSPLLLCHFLLQKWTYKRVLLYTSINTNNKLNKDNTELEM